MLERAAILCEGGAITQAICACNQARSHSAMTPPISSVVERTTIGKVLGDCRGNKTKAARRLGLSRTQVHLRIRKYHSRKLSSRNRWSRPSAQCRSLRSAARGRARDLNEPGDCSRRVSPLGPDGVSFKSARVRSVLCGIGGDVLGLRNVVLS